MYNKIQSQKKEKNQGGQSDMISVKPYFFEIQQNYILHMSFGGVKQYVTLGKHSVL